MSELTSSITGTVQIFEDATTNSTSESGVTISFQPCTDAVQPSVQTNGVASRGESKHESEVEAAGFSMNTLESVSYCDSSAAVTAERNEAIEQRESHKTGALESIPIPISISAPKDANANDLVSLGDSHTGEANVSQDQVNESSLNTNATEISSASFQTDSPATSKYSSPPSSPDSFTQRSLNSNQWTMLRKQIGRAAGDFSSSSALAGSGQADDASRPLFTSTPPKLKHSAPNLSAVLDENANQRRKRGSPFRSVLFAKEAISYMSKRKKSQVANEEFMKRFSLRRPSEQLCETDATKDLFGSKLNFTHGDLNKFIFHPNEPLIFAWLTVVSAACLYNLWSLIARQAFSELNDDYARSWKICDVVADLIYFFDVFVQFRTGFLKHGMMVYSDAEMATRYLYSRTLALDLISLAQPSLVIPARFTAALGRYALMLRCVRFVKVYRALKWSEMIQNSTQYPNVWRVTTLTHFLLLGCHWFAAFYFMISEYESFATQWTYPPPEGEYATMVRKYLLCFSWAVLTLTNVGADKTPETNLELTFTILCFLLGLYVFAAIVGQVSNVVMENYAHRMEFEKMLDTAKGYLTSHQVSPDLQSRVIRWYEYMWLKGGIQATQDVNALQLLPEKLKTEISIFVHSKSLQKVTIFQQCRPEFLQSLVLKMKMLICTPGDYICRKNEIAKEMFIIIDGVVEVVNDQGRVLKQMVAGDFFGEIGILNLHGGHNRRTADVRSLGYAQLFVLSRDDVLESLKDDSDAEAILREYAKERLRSLNQSQATDIRPTQQIKSERENVGISVTQPTENSDVLTTTVGAAFDKFAAEVKDSFSQSVDQVVSKYREEIGVLEKRMRQLEDELRKANHAGCNSAPAAP